MRKNKYFSIKKICLIGMLSALVLIFTFFRIDIPSPLGKTMLHLGNTICLMSGLLFGPIVGGLSAGFGSFIFDLFDPTFAPEAWITFINKFIMAFVAGVIANQFKKLKLPNWTFLLASLAGSVSYTILYLSKHFIATYFILGFELEAVLIDITTKASISLANSIVSVVVAFLFFTLLRPALKRAKLFDNEI